MAQSPLEVIRSAANPALRRVARVRAGKERDLVLLEGARLVADASAAGLALELVLVAEGRAAAFAEVLAQAGEGRVVADDLLRRVSALDTSPGVLALAQRPRVLKPEDVEFPAHEALVLVVAGIADPGNLGALARSAEAAGAHALIVVQGGARPFSEKALRGSMGSLLRLPVIEVEDTRTCHAALAARGLRQVCASIGDGEPYTTFSFAGPLALWLPGEVGEAGTALADLPRLRIPMAGQVESLNVTVAASLLLFAAGRAPRR